MLERHGMEVLHFAEVEGALEHLHQHRGREDGNLGADLVLKPIEERLLVTKALFQLRLSRMPEQRSFDA
jgi:phosphopantothenate synthetase